MTSPLPKLLDPSQPADGRHDFNFITGRWLVGNKRLKKRLAGCTDWDASRPCRTAPCCSTGWAT